MSTFKLTKKDNNHYLAEGDLTFFTINKKTIHSLEFLRSVDELCIDLTKINRADSAGLALLIEWIKHSKLYRTHLSFINIPEQLLILARLSGFDLNGFDSSQVLT